MRTTISRVSGGVGRHARAALAAAILTAGGAAATGPAHAAAWVDPGDLQLRADIELLAAYGFIDGTLNTWPIPWNQISRNIGLFTAEGYPPHVAEAMRRVTTELNYQTAIGKPRTQVDVRVTNEPALIHDFGHSARQEVDTEVTFDYLWSEAAVRVSVGYDGDFDFDGGKKLSLDGSYLAAVAFDNWLIYGGWVDQWWGPGWDGNLILTNNARPFPKIGFMRNNPTPFEWPVLNLLGPWQINGIIGLMEDNSSRQVNNVGYVALRVSAMPINGLELGASRAIQLCGEGRPCGFRNIGKAIFGNTNTGNLASDVANQIAGVDASYRNHVGPIAFSIWGSVYGEDEAGNLPSREAVTAGLSLAGPLGSNGVGWRIIGEYANTISGDVVGKSRNPGVWYNSGAYPSGYRYLQRSVGHTADGDAEIFSIAAIITDTMDRTWRFKYINLDLNQFNNRRLQLSPSGPEKINIFEAGLAWPTQWGLFDVDLRYMDNRPDSPGSDKDDFAAELRWSARF